VSYGRMPTTGALLITNPRRKRGKKMPHLPLRLNGTRLLRFWGKQPGVEATRRDLEDAKFGRTNSITPAGKKRLKTAGITVYSKSTAGKGKSPSGQTKKSYSAARDKMMKKAGYRDRPRVGKKEIGLTKGVKGAKGWTNSEMAFLANAEAREKLFTKVIGVLNGEKSTTTKAKSKKAKAKKGGSKAKSRSVAKSGMSADLLDRRGNFNLMKAKNVLIKEGVITRAQSKKMTTPEVMALLMPTMLSNPRRKKAVARAGRRFAARAAIGGRPAGYKMKRVPKRHQTASGAFSKAKVASEIKKKAEKAGASTGRGKFSYKQLMKLGRKGLQNRLNEVDNLLKTNPYGGSMARIGRHKKRRKLPVRKHRSIKLRKNRRKNPRHNPLVGSGIKAIQDVTKKVPVVGKAISAATPAAVYAVPAFFAHKFIASQVKDFMDSNEMLNQDYFGMGYLNPSHYAYTLTGITAAALLQSKVIPSNLLSAQSKKGIGAALVIVGVVSDMVTDSDEGAMGALHMDMNGLQLDMNGLQLDMNGLQLDMNGYGDGGQYYISGMGGMHEYGDAEMVDAYFSGHDLDQDEGFAALAGPGAWRKRFKMRRRAVKSGGRGSKHAGKKGHRWGWLIKLIGFQKFQQLAALPPQQRMQVIKGLKQKAVAHINQQLAQGGPVGPAVLQETGVASENFDVLSTEGLDGWGYGAVMLAGSSY
jgi:hypothetical protein